MVLEESNKDNNMQLENICPEHWGGGSLQLSRSIDGVITNHTHVATTTTSRLDTIILVGSNFEDYKDIRIVLEPFGNLSSHMLRLLIFLENVGMLVNFKYERVAS